MATTTGPTAEQKRLMQIADRVGELAKALVAETGELDDDALVAAYHGEPDMITASLFRVMLEERGIDA